MLALWLAVAVAGPVPVEAAPARGKSKAQGPLEKVRALSQEAQTRFETADYEGAIELWTQAYAALPEETRYGPQRSALAYQIAQACVEAYSIDPKLTYLRKAERLFESYLPLVGAGDGETRAEVQETLDDLRRRIAEAEAQEREREREAAGREAEPREDEQRAAEERARAEERDRGSAARRRALTISGGVVLGVGAVGLAVMGYGLAAGAGVDRRGEAAKAAGETDPAVYDALLREGTRANVVALVSGVIGGVVAVTGAGLLAKGLFGRGRGRRELTWAPRWIPGGAGVGVFGRF